MDYFFSKDRDFKLDSSIVGHIDYKRWKSLIGQIDGIIWNEEADLLIGGLFGPHSSKDTAYLNFNAWCGLILYDEAWSLNNSLHVYDYTLMFNYEINREFGLARFPDKVDNSYIPLLLEISRELDCYLLKSPNNWRSKYKIITEKDIL